MLLNGVCIGERVTEDRLKREIFSFLIFLYKKQRYLSKPLTTSEKRIKKYLVSFANSMVTL